MNNMITLLAAPFRAMAFLLDTVAEAKRLQAEMTQNKKEHAA